jgi:hypothetical protein
VVVLLVDNFEDSIEELLEVKEVDDSLPLEAPGEPGDQNAMEGLDFAVGFRVSCSDADAVRTELCGPVAEGHGVEDGSAVGIDEVG